MSTYGTRRRRAVVTVVAATALLAPAAGFGGYALGQDLVRDADPVAAPATPPPSPLRSPDPTTPSASSRPVALSDEARALADRAVVRLSPPDGSWFGSGSIVSPDGLVLTNAHVARPSAPGLATTYGAETTYGPDPEQLVVSTVTGDAPAQPAYLADVLAVDGYLDLAVLRIVTDAEGAPLPAGTRLPAIPLGSAADLRKGDDLTVYGFPGVTGGDLLAVAPGAVRTFVPDRRGRVDAARFDIETTAEFSGGNSGGMALDNAGRLVGVPRGRAVEKADAAISRFARAVDLAAPLLEAARTGASYASPYLVPSTAQERADDVGWTDAWSCTSEAVEVLSTADEVGVGRAVLTGFADGEDVLLVLEQDGEVVRSVATTYSSKDDCLAVRLPQLDGGVVGGEYRLQVLAGPQRRLVASTQISVEAAGG